MMKVFWNQRALTATQHREHTSNHFQMIKTVNLTFRDFHLDFFFKEVEL